MNDHETTLDTLKAAMAAFVAERQWQKFHRPKNLAMSLAIETAELMEHFQWLDHDESQRLIADDTARGEIADEVADIFSFLLSFANATGIDLAAAFESKMRKNALKYPADQIRGEYKKPKKKQH